MSEAGKEEKQIAIGNNSYHDPNHISAVSMIVDGGWPKHSHWHPYNTKSGVAIILLARPLERFYTWACVTSIVTFEVDIPNTHLNTIVYFINGKSHLLLWKVVSLLRALKSARRQICIIHRQWWQLSLQSCKGTRVGILHHQDWMYQPLS